MLGAFQLHGIRPGPMLSVQFPTFVPYIAAVLLLAALMMRFCALFACSFAPSILKVPTHILMPIIAVISCIGAYAPNINIYDLYIILIFGVIGYACNRFSFPVAPIVLGLILGPLADINGRRMLQRSGGSLQPFVTQPISIVLLIFIIITILYQMGIFSNIKNALPVCAAPMGKLQAGIPLDSPYFNNNSAYAEELIQGCYEAGGIAWVGDNLQEGYFEGQIAPLKNCSGIGIPTIKPWESDALLEKRFHAVRKAGACAVAIDVDAIGLCYQSANAISVRTRSVSEWNDIIARAHPHLSSQRAYCR